MTRLDSGLRDALLTYAVDHADLHEDVVAKDFLQRCTPGYVTALAEYGAATVVWAQRRSRAADVEAAAAARRAADQRAQLARKAAKKSADAASAQVHRWTELRNHPSYAAASRLYARERRDFASWLARNTVPTTDGDETWFGRLYAAAAAEDVAEGRDPAEMGSKCWHAQMDWDPDFAANDRFSRLSAAVSGLVADTAAATRLEVTQELLSSIFALGDGTRVTWGEATIEQHEQRIAMLTTSISGTVETAARHEVAVEMIRSAGVRTLGEVKEAQ